MLLDQIPWLEIWMDQLCVHVLCFPAAAIVSPFLSSLVSKSSKPGCIYLWSWSRSFDAKGKGCQQTLSAVILAELEWSTTDMSYLTLSTCPGRSTHFLGSALPSYPWLSFDPWEQPGAAGRGLDFRAHEGALLSPLQCSSSTAQPQPSTSWLEITPVINNYSCTTRGGSQGWGRLSCTGFQSTELRAVEPLGC